MDCRVDLCFCGELCIVLPSYTELPNVIDSRQMFLIGGEGNIIYKNLPQLSSERHYLTNPLNYHAHKSQEGIT